MIRWGPVLLMTVAASACGPKGNGVVCNNRDFGGPFCTPDAGRAANIDVKLELRDDCTSACDTGVVDCVVRYDGGTRIDLALVGVACSDPMASCPAVCGIKTYTCDLPPIPDGTYTVTSAGQTSRTLEFGVGGSVGCTLPAGP